MRHLEQFVVAVRRLTRIRRRFRARFEALIAEEGGRQDGWRSRFDVRDVDLPGAAVAMDQIKDGGRQRDEFGEVGEQRCV